MRKAIYLLTTLLVLWCVGSEQVRAQASVGTRTPETIASRDHLRTAIELYNAGEWAAAAYELDKAAEILFVDDRSLVAEIEILSAFCAARLESPDAGERLAVLLEKYPDSPRVGEMRFRAGVFRHDTGDGAGALKMFEEVDPDRLPAADRDEYHFKAGHSLFVSGDAQKARSEFAEVSAGSIYAPHAGYYTAYMDYEAGNYSAAKQTFRTLADHPSYKTLIPYYLLQIEYNEGNWTYVAENADKLISQTAMPRRAEITGMAAQSHFRLGNYQQALSSMESFADAGGTMTREENYLMGYSLYMQGSTREAAQYLANATGADDALSQNASYHLADIYIREGDRGRALQSFSIAANSGYDQAITEDALFNYGKLLFETDSGRFNESINVLGRYLATWPDSPRAAEAREYLIAAYYNSNDYGAAYNAIMQHPDPDNDMLAALQKITYFRALEMWRASDDETGAAEALRLLETSSNYRYNAKYTALALFWQGEILFYMGDYPAAVSKFEEYLRLSPTTESENVMARYDLGYAYFNLQRWKEADGRFDDFLGRHTANDSWRADALNRKGDVAHAQKEYWRAIENYDAATATGTDHRYYSAYQRALMLGLVDRTDRKIEGLQTIITTGEGPWVEEATYELARTYISGERYSDGAGILAGFIERYPDSPLRLPALSNLGLAWLNMGDRKRSMEYYKMIVESAPWSREAQDALAGIRGLYVDADDVDGYFAYVKSTGVPADVGELQRDSLSFAAAERIYLSGDGEKAIAALENYTRGDARGGYIPTALDYLSDLYFEAGRYAEAADAYKRFWGLSSDPSAKSHAMDGYVASAIATKDPALIVSVADEVATLPGISPKTLTAAIFAKAGVLRSGGRTAEANEIYRTLAADPQTPEGAESAYRVIEYLFETGEVRAAEQAVFDLSQSDTPHGYWLGQAFLTLGDIYVGDGDTFQARATYQSIVDGYSPENDGIVAAARERIANLK